MSGLEELDGQAHPDNSQQTESYLEAKWIMMDNYAQAYMLGYPIHIHLPSQSEIDKSWNDLKSAIIGGDLQKYIDESIERHKKTMNFIIKSIYPGKNIQIITDLSESIEDGNVGVILHNTENVLMESILEYSPFDTMHFVIDSHLYSFSRPEFKNMSITGKNPYTNIKLPTSYICQIMARLLTAQNLNLPDSVPLIDMLNNFINSTPVTLPAHPPFDFGSLYPSLFMGPIYEGDEMNSIILNGANQEDSLIVNQDSLSETISRFLQLSDGYSPQMINIPISAEEESEVLDAEIRSAHGRLQSLVARWGDPLSVREHGGVMHHGEPYSEEFENFPYETIDLVMRQTGVDHQAALDSLRSNDGDVVNAIMYLLDGLAHPASLRDARLA